MRLRVGEPWMSGKDYGTSLQGLSINLLVADIEAALLFQREVLSTTFVYSDPDFAVCSHSGSEWMLHADHTYENHPMRETTPPRSPRGGGIEIRIHGRDPDASEAAARRLGFDVLSSATDKGHGLREAHIRDRDGYVWVPDVQI